jgi:hypothetical protein
MKTLELSTSMCKLPVIKNYVISLFCETVFSSFSEFLKKKKFELIMATLSYGLFSQNPYTCTIKHFTTVINL